jgi:hypothetical protein
MYCQHCGAESTQGLNYCNRCGGQIGAISQPAPREVGHQLTTGTAWAAGVSMFLVVMAGIGATVSLVDSLARSGVRPEPLVLIMMCGSITVLGSLFMLTRFWMRLLSLGKSAPADAPPLFQRASHTNELGPPQPFASLHDAPIPSVTEQTTRTLEHAKRK